MSMTSTIIVTLVMWVRFNWVVQIKNVYISILYRGEITEKNKIYKNEKNELLFLRLDCIYELISAYSHIKSLSNINKVYVNVRFVLKD